MKEETIAILPEWNNQTKYYVVGSDGSIAMGPTTVKQIAIDHAAAMNRTNSEDDMRLWRVISRGPLKVNTHFACYIRESDT